MADLAAIAALSGFGAPGGAGGGPAPPPAAGGWADLVNRVGTSRRQHAPLVFTPPAPRPAPAPQHHGRSLFGQLRDVVTGLPQGIGHLGQSLGVELYHDVRGPFFGWDTPHPGRFAVSNVTHGNAPLSTELGGSYARTAGDIRHPTHFAQASQNSAIVGKLLEDITNASIVAHGVGSGLGAASEATGSEALGRAAAHTERVARLGGKVAESPFLPARVTASLARQGLDLAAERGVPAVGRLRGGALAERYPEFFTEPGRESRLITKEGVKGRTRAEAVLHRIGRGLERTGITPEEQAAAYAIYTGQGALPEAFDPVPAEAAVLGRAPGIAEVATEPPTTGGRFTPEEMQRILSPTAVEGAHYSPEARAVAEEYLANPETHPTITTALETHARTIGGMQQLGREMGASWVPNLEEYANSPDVLNMVRDRWIGENAKTLREIGKTLDPQNPVAAGADEYFTHMQGQGVFPELDDSWSQLENSPESYSAIWRGHMEAADRARQILLERGDTAGAEAIPYLPRELQAAGVEAKYLPSGRPLSTVPKTERLNYAKTREGVLGDIPLSSEHGRGFNPVTGEYVGVESAAPYRIQDLYGQLGKEAGNMTLRKAYRDIIEQHGQTIDQILDPEELQAIQSDAHARAARENPGMVDPETGQLFGQAASEYQRYAGREYINAALRKGMEPWVTTGRATADIKPSDVGGDTKFLQAGLKQRLAAQWLTPKPAGVTLSTLEAINKKFKGAVLPASLRWQIGDFTTNQLLAWVSGDVDPITMAKRMHQVATMPEGEVRTLLEQHAPMSGLTFGENLSLAPEDLTPEITWQNKGESFRRHPIKTLQQPGFKFNNFQNRLAREAFTLEHLDRQLSQRGLTLEQAGADPNAGPVREAMTAAVKRADDALGAYDDMSPFEKRVVRNIFPFWSWIRNITRISFNLAVDHPLRAAWIMRVGQLGVDPNSELPDFLRGSINTPLGRIDSNFLNAFADPTAQSVLTPEGALRSVSPGIKVAAAAGLGLDLNRSGLPLSRPTGTGRTDTLGRVSNTPLWNRPGELGYYLAQQIPQTRVAINLAPVHRVPGTNVTVGPVARYAQGSLLTRGRSRAPLDTDPRLLDALGLVGVPIPMQQQDVNALVASMQRRARAAKRQHR